KTRSQKQDTHLLAAIQATIATSILAQFTSKRCVSYFVILFDGGGYGKGGMGTLSVNASRQRKAGSNAPFPSAFHSTRRWTLACTGGHERRREYVSKRAFEFAGSLKKVVVELGKTGLAFVAG